MDSQNTPENPSARVVFPLRTANPAGDAPADKAKGSGGRRTVLYARVSTADQTLAHQREQAEAAGFRLDEVVADHGVSGVGTRLADRPQGKRLFDILRAGDTLVVRWVDRLGRNYGDVTDTIRDFIRRGVVVRTVINKMTFDGATKDPMQQAVRDALIAFMAATAQAQAEATKEAQRAGIVYAQANDDGTKFRGRKPTFDWETFAVVQQMLAQGLGVAEVAKVTGLKRQTIYRIQKDPGRQAAALAAWSQRPNELIAA
jgi:putative DNA-invertase from lambdoid prophage Rac